MNHTLAPRVSFEAGSNSNRSHITLRTLFFLVVLGFASGDDSSGKSNGFPLSFTTKSFWGANRRVNHHSTVGFPSADSTEELLDLAKAFVQNPDTAVLPAYQVGFRMFHLPCKCGAELWGGGDSENVFFGYNPHFFGPSRLRMKLYNITETDAGLDREAIVKGYACDPREGDPNDGIDFDINEHNDDILNLPSGLHFDFFCPNYQLYGVNLKLPIIVTVQVAAFALEFNVWDSPRDYQEYNRHRKEQDHITFAEQSFIACLSVFDPDDVAIAVMTGRVVKAELKVNERSGESFYWALVETVDDCQFDVVIPPSLVDPLYPPRPGCIVQGAFWLSGRLLPDENDALLPDENDASTI